MAGSVSKTPPDAVWQMVDQMQQRLGDLYTLQASPDMYGSESLDGQVAELELWLVRFDTIRDRDGH